MEDLNFWPLNTFKKGSGAELVWFKTMGMPRKRVFSIYFLPCVFSCTYYLLHSLLNSVFFNASNSVSEAAPLPNCCIFYGIPLKKNNLPVCPLLSTSQSSVSELPSCYSVLLYIFICILGHLSGRILVLSGIARDGLSRSSCDIQPSPLHPPNSLLCLPRNSKSLFDPKRRFLFHTGGMCPL